jgi:hypothetical protein
MTGRVAFYRPADKVVADVRRAPCDAEIDGLERLDVGDETLVLSGDTWNGDHPPTFTPGPQE